MHWGGGKLPGKAAPRGVPHYISLLRCQCTWHTRHHAQRHGQSQGLGAGAAKSGATEVPRPLLRGFFAVHTSQVSRWGEKGDAIFTRVEDWNALVVADSPHLCALRNALPFHLRDSFHASARTLRSPPARPPPHVWACASSSFFSVCADVGAGRGDGLIFTHAVCMLGL